jgi:hypothetical protein
MTAACIAPVITEKRSRETRIKSNVIMIQTVLRDQWTW